LRIGVISDTHDLLRSTAKDFLRGSDLIIHAGDICGTAVLEELSRIAPVAAVRGNNDRGEWAAGLPETRLEQVGSHRIYVIHDLARIGLDPAASGVGVVISGHSHRPLAKARDGVLYLNPGSAGRRRFKLPISIAEIIIEGDRIEARLVELAA